VLGACAAPLIFAGAAIAVTVHVPYDNGPPIRSDGLGYHTWTRALLDGHLSFCPYLRRSSPHAISAPQKKTGRCANRYPPGLALLRFPVMAPFTVANHGQLRSGAEDAVDQWFAIVAGVVAVSSMVYAGEALGAGVLFANLAALALAFGTGLFHYATYDSSFTHVYNAAMLGLLLACVVAWTKRPRAGLIVAAAILSFLVVLTREPLVIVIVVMGGAWMLHEVRQLGGREAVERHRSIVIAAAAGCAAALALLIAYNAFVFGYFTVSSYGQETFVFSRFHQLDVAFSFQKGLVTWYPVVAVVLVAAILARRVWGVLYFLAATVPLVVLYGFWDQWSLAGGFGHRGFVDVVPFYGVIFAVCLRSLGRRLRAVILVAAALSLIATLSLMRAYWDGSISMYGLTYAQWRHFAWGRGSFFDPF